MCPGTYLTHTPELGVKMSNLASPQSSNEFQQVPNDIQHGAAASTNPAPNSAGDKKVTPENVVKRNIANAQHSSGPGDTSKTRFNALKHGLRAQVFTPFDDPEAYHEIVRGLDILYPIKNPMAK